jgi:hypothetical protein
MRAGISVTVAFLLSVTPALLERRKEQEMRLRKEVDWKK